MIFTASIWREKQFKKIAFHTKEAFLEFLTEVEGKDLDCTLIQVIIESSSFIGRCKIGQSLHLRSSMYYAEDGYDEGLSMDPCYEGCE